jgi:hypothetical protein
MAINIPVDLLAKLTAQLQDQLGAQVLPGDELEKILHALLQSALARLDLVSRTEFDAQCRVLEKTRSRLEEAESRLSKLCESRSG